MASSAQSAADRKKGRKPQAQESVLRGCRLWIVVRPSRSPLPIQRTVVSLLQARFCEGRPRSWRTRTSAGFEFLAALCRNSMPTEPESLGYCGSEQGHCRLADTLVGRQTLNRPDFSGGPLREQWTEERGIPRGYGNGRCGWSWISRVSTVHSGWRLSRSRRRSVVCRRGCAGGCGRRSGTGSARWVDQHRDVSDSRRWSGRTENCAGRTRSCARRQPILPRRSLTVDPRHDVVHQRRAGGLRGQADLQADHPAAPFTRSRPGKRTAAACRPVPVATRDSRQRCGLLSVFFDTQAAVDPDRRMGMTGYCLGGPITMRIARARADRVGAGASFRGGGLVTDQPDSPHLLVSEMDAHYLFAIAENDDMDDPEAKRRAARDFRGRRTSHGDRGLRRHTARLVSARFRRLPRGAG